MTISYGLGFNPIWYIANNIGLPAAGGFLQTVSNLNPQTIKYVYKDAAGPDGEGPWPVVPIPNVLGKFGIQFNANGQQGPFFFQFDTQNPDDLYTLFAYDSSGNLIWTMEDYNPVGEGGGSVITEVQNAQNFLVNPLFWRHINDVATISSTAFRIAPGAHSALAQTSSNANPDIWFLKNNTTATDSLTFPDFTFGLNEFAPDSTPTFYAEYKCTSAGNNETLKCVQIPIMQNVANFSNTEVTVTLWINSLSGINTTVTPSWWQFFGDGTPATAAIPTDIASWTVVPGWNKYTATVIVPSVILSPVPAVVGPCHNDGLFLRIGFPLNATCDIGFTKPSLYLGNVNVQIDYQTYDQIDSVINAPRTGNVVFGFDTSAPPGYLSMNDGTIGSATSGATTRANNDTFPLYNLLWNGTSANPTYAPVTGGRGASAIADFQANKPIQLLYALGAVIGNTGQANSSVYGNPYNAFQLGQPFGNDRQSITADQLPPHSHTYTGLSGVGAGGVASTTGFLSTTLNTGNGPGTSALVNIDQPTVRFNYFIKL